MKTSGERGSDSDISGRFLDVSIDNSNNSLEEFLATTTFPQTLWECGTSDDDLLYPLKDGSITFNPEEYSDHEIEGIVHFGSVVVNSQKPSNWRRNLLRHLRTDFEQSHRYVLDLDHRSGEAFYVAVGGGCAVEVEVGSTIDDCHVGINLVTLYELNDASNGRIPKSEPAYPEDNRHVANLTGYVSVFTSVIDTVTDQYGTPMQGGVQRPWIRLSAPRPQEAEQLDTNDEQDEHGEPYDAPYNGGLAIEYSTTSADAFSEIGGLTHAKERLNEIAAAFCDPEGTAMYDLKPSYFVLHGPPGTGKTSLAEAFAKQTDSELMVIDSSMVVDMWIGNSAKNVRKLGESIKARSDVDGRVVVFFDEFETVARQNTTSGEHRELKKRLNLLIDELRADYPNVILCAATNADIDDLEPSLMRSGRFEPVGAPAPNESERFDVWVAVLSKLMTNALTTSALTKMTQSLPVEHFSPYGDLDFQELAKTTEGMTGSDFEAILLKARYKKYLQFKRTGDAGVVEQKDVLEEITRFGR